MRCLKVFAALLILLFLNTAVCFALEEETTDNYSSFYELSGADSLDDSLHDDVKDSLDSAGIDISNWQSMLSPSPKKIISMFADIARGSFKKPIKDMVIIAGVVILVGLIKGTAAAENFSEPLNIVIGCAVAITVFASSAGVISQGMSAVETTSDFMLALIPVLAGIITAAGNPTLALTYGSFAMAAAQAAAQAVHLLAPDALGIEHQAGLEHVFAHHHALLACALQHLAECRGQEHAPLGVELGLYVSQESHTDGHAAFVSAKIRIFLHTAPLSPTFLRLAPHFLDLAQPAALPCRRGPAAAALPRGGKLCLPRHAAPRPARALRNGTRRNAKRPAPQARMAQTASPRGTFCKPGPGRGRNGDGGHGRRRPNNVYKQGAGRPYCAAGDVGKC